MALPLAKELERILFAMAYGTADEEKLSFPEYNAPRKQKKTKHSKIKGVEIIVANR
jgi:hypothetical protein